MYRLRSWSLTISASCLRTYAASPFTFFLRRSGPSKEISSSSFSMIVCSRRAPIFSDDSFTCAANLATSSSASSVSDILLGERVFRLFEDPDKVFHRERFQLDTDRKPALQFRYQIAGLRNVERS